MRQIFEEFGINERDFFEARGKEVLKWAQSVVGEVTPSKLQEKLASLFTETKPAKKPGRKPKAAGAKKKSRKKKSSGSEPKLPAGTYTNPVTSETIQKVRCAPKQLLDWVEKHGFETVSAWRQNEGAEK